MKNHDSIQPVKASKQKRKRSIDGYTSDNSFIVSDIELSKRSSKRSHKDDAGDGLQVPQQHSSAKLKKIKGIDQSKKNVNGATDKEDETLLENNITVGKENRIGTIKVRQNLVSDCNEAQMSVHDSKGQNEHRKAAVVCDASDGRETKKKIKRKREKNLKDKKRAKLDKEFMKMGSLKPPVRSKVQRVLPYWLSHPRPLSSELHGSSCTLDTLPCLHPSLAGCLREDGITSLFPVQRALIPEILAQASVFETGLRPNDLCVSCATGSGKTLAYALPVLQTLAPLTSLPCRLLALVLLPTEQLALQIYSLLRKYGNAVGVKIGAAVGGTSFHQEQSELVEGLEAWERALLLEGGSQGPAASRYRSLVHVVVATPDRLKDHIALTPGFELAHLRYLIFDEADRLVSGDGGQWMNSIVRAVTEQQTAAAGGDGGPLAGQALYSSFTCTSDGSGAGWPVQFAQKLLVSATLSCDPEKLDALNLFDPILFTTTAADPRRAHSGAGVASFTPAVAVVSRPSTLKEQYVLVPQESVQPLVLHHLLVRFSWRRTLVFVNTREAAHKLSIVLRSLAGDLYKVGEFSSDLGKFRRRTAQDFKRGVTNVLISTDGLSRGMDFTDVCAVVNYDSTQCKDTYVHRVGRTARAGRNGTALTMLHSKEQLQKFKSSVHMDPDSLDAVTVEVKELHPYEQQYMDALAELRRTVSQERAGSKHGKRRQMGRPARRPAGRYVGRSHPKKVNAAKT